jgi:hypothetical protein
LCYSCTKPHLAARKGKPAHVFNSVLPLHIALQIVSFARQSHLAEFVAGDLKGGQLVVVTGPSNRLFATEEDLSELEFVTLLGEGAQEAAEVQAPQGYRGDDVIAYKTAKVGGGVRWLAYAADHYIGRVHRAGPMLFAWKQDLHRAAAKPMQYICCHSLCQLPNDKSSNACLHHLLLPHHVLHQVGLDLICERIKVPRKTKIVCTLGPACWSHEGLVGLLEGGMGVARFNFSHGSHADHQQVCVCCHFSAGQEASQPLLLHVNDCLSVNSACLESPHASCPCKQGCY